jgi:hypothetical protein
MNTGIQDIHNLVHKLCLIYSLGDLNKKQEKVNNILHFYSEERKFYSNFISSTAMKYYNTSLEIPRKLGMSYDNLLTFKSAVDILAGVVGH